MLRIGTEKKGFVVLTNKEMKRIEKGLFRARVENLTVNSYADVLVKHLADENKGYFESLDLWDAKCIKRHSQRNYNILQRVYNGLKLYKYL